MVRNSSADGQTSSETRQSRARRRATVDALRSSRLFLCTVQAKKGRGGEERAGTSLAPTCAVDNCEHALRKTRLVFSSMFLSSSS